MVWFLSRRTFSTAALWGLVSPKVADAAPRCIFDVYDYGASPKATMAENTWLFSRLVQN